MVYTKKQERALVVFTFIIICSVIEIVLAAAMMKNCETTTKTPQLASSCGAYYQVLFLPYCLHIAAFDFKGRSVILLFIRCLHCFRGRLLVILLLLLSSGSVNS